MSRQEVDHPRGAVGEPGKALTDHFTNSVRQSPAPIIILGRTQMLSVLVGRFGQPWLGQVIRADQSAQPLACAAMGEVRPVGLRSEHLTQIGFGPRARFD